MSTSDEEPRLARWLEQDSNEDGLEESYDLVSIRKSLEVIDGIELPPLQIEEAWKQQVAKQEESSNQSVTRRRAWLVTVAACLVVLLGIFSLVKIKSPDTQLTFAEGSSYHLPSGRAQVIFRTAGTLTHATNDPNALHLTGEAYFQVTPGESFSVATPWGIVEVLGTRFTISSDPHPAVHCYSGRVQVTINGTEQILEAGQRVSHQQGSLELERVADHSPGWIGERGVIQKLSFNQLVDLIANEHDIAIEYPGGINRNFRGDLPIQDLELTFEILAKALQLNIKKLENDRYVIESVQ